MDGRVADPQARISDEERARRKVADDYARGGIRLEGFTACAFPDQVTRRSIDVEITGERLTAASRAHHGLE